MAISSNDIILSLPDLGLALIGKPRYSRLLYAGSNSDSDAGFRTIATSVLAIKTVLDLGLALTGKPRHYQLLYAGSDDAGFRPTVTSFLAINTIFQDLYIV